MFQTIHEQCAVVGVYDQGAFQPRKFLWKRREYLVEQVTLVTDFKDGGIRKRMYSLVSGATVYRLVFDRTSEKWFIEEVWYE